MENISNLLGMIDLVSFIQSAKRLASSLNFADVLIMRGLYEDVPIDRVGWRNGFRFA